MSGVSPANWSEDLGRKEFDRCNYSPARYTGGKTVNVIFLVVRKTYQTELAFAGFLICNRMLASVPGSLAMVLDQSASGLSARDDTAAGCTLVSSCSFVERTKGHQLKDLTSSIRRRLASATLSARLISSQAKPLLVSDPKNLKFGDLCTWRQRKEEGRQWGQGR